MARALAWHQHGLMSLLLCALSAGIVCAQWAPCLDVGWQCAAALFAVLALAVALRLAASGARHAPHLGDSALICAALAAIAAGQAYGSFSAATRLADGLAARHSDRPLTVEAWVADLPQAVHGGLRLQLALASAAFGEGLPSRVSVTLPDKVSHPGVPVTGGACVRVTLRLQPPHSQVNFAGFDGEAWLWANGVRATGKVLALAACSEFSAPHSAAVQALRDAVRGRLLAVLGDRPAAGIVIALAVGDQGDVSQAQWTVLWRSGVGHLVSISGVHVTLLASLLRHLGERLWRCSSWACRRCPANRAGAAIGFMAALAYALVAGFGIPTRRTLFMLAVAWLCTLRGMLPGGLRVFWAAVAVTLVCDPFAGLSPSFWLSFGAVGGLILADHGRFGRQAAWTAELGTQWVSTLCLLPMIAVYFGQVSLVAPLANLVAIPLVGWVVTPLSLAAMFPGFEGLALPAERLLEILLAGLAWVAAPDWAALDLVLPPPWAVGLAAVAVLLLLSPPGRLPGRGWALLGLLPLLVPAREPLADGRARIEVVDLGQGLSVVVRTGAHLLVFDTGPRWPGGDAGSRTLLPLLRAEGISHVDRLVLSHPDADHVGGADSLLAALPIDAVLSGFHRPGAQPCAAGQSWVWEGVMFRMLYPPPEPLSGLVGAARSDSMQRGGHAHDRNNHACVLRVSSGSHAVLLPADIESPAESALLGDPAGANLLASDVVIVAHHGSKTSSTAPFIAATGARWAVASLGWHNHYRHPNPQVVARWEAAGARFLRTDRDGALRIELDASGVEVNSARAARPAFWRDVQ
jgi:competence protein ComEC